MSDEMPAKDRSPRSPLISLEEAIEVARRLYAQARSASVKAESAVRALGYSGLTGSSMTLLATLGQYGLIERNAGSVSVSPLAVRILHPSSGDQRDTAIREASSLPKVFQDQLVGFENCSVEIIANHLIQEGFAPDRAKKVAIIYLENRRFAKLDEFSRESESRDVFIQSDSPKPPDFEAFDAFSNIKRGESSQINLLPAALLGSKMLAQYTIPLGENQATLVFTGSALTVEDFDALSDFVEFAKRQFVRKSRKQDPPRLEMRANEDSEG